MVQKELEAQRELVDYGGSFQPNAPPPCKFDVILDYVLLRKNSMNSHLFRDAYDFGNHYGCILRGLYRNNFG